MPGFISDSPLARELIRIGDEAIATEDDAKLRAYFRDDYVFHGPGGDFLAARTTFSGDFIGVFTYSPIGRVEPTGQHLESESSARSGTTTVGA